MVRAHRQAWAWQDEWHGLTIDDIRDLEMQTQQALAQKMEHAVEDSPQQHPFSEVNFLLHLLNCLVICSLEILMENVILQRSCLAAICSCS